MSQLLQWSSLARVLSQSHVQLECPPERQKKREEKISCYSIKKVRVCHKQLLDCGLIIFRSIGKQMHDLHKGCAELLLNTTWAKNSPCRWIICFRAFFPPHRQWMLNSCFLTTKLIKSIEKKWNSQWFQDKTHWLNVCILYAMKKNPNIDFGKLIKSCWSVSLAMYKKASFPGKVRDTSAVN